MQRTVVAGILAATLLGVAVGLCAYTFVYAKGYSYLTNNPAACANCHVMIPSKVPESRILIFVTMLSAAAISAKPTK